MFWKPIFKGNIAYECQIGPYVLQWRHDGKKWRKDYPLSGPGFTLGRFHAWFDHSWWRGPFYADTAAAVMYEAVYGDIWTFIDEVWHTRFFEWILPEVHFNFCQWAHLRDDPEWKAWRRHKKIMTDEQYERTLARLYKLMDAEPDSPEEIELDIAARQVEEYEATHYPMGDINDHTD